jgi:hypothetical protein
MTRTKWLLLGAVLLGLAVGLYILFSAPRTATDLRVTTAVMKLTILL